MRSLKILLGILCSVLGAIPPYLLYSYTGSPDSAPSTTDKLYTIGVLAIVVAICFVTSLLSRRFFKEAKVLQFFIGTLGSYFILLLLLFAGLALSGDFVETLAWMPVILLCGIPVLAPLIIMTWVGTCIMFSKKRESDKVSYDGVDK